MADVNSLLKKYKDRKAVPTRVKNVSEKTDALSNEALTIAITQISGILDYIVKSNQSNKARFEDICDSQEIGYMALLEVLTDKGIISKEEVEAKKILLDTQYKEGIEKMFDEKNHYFTVDRPVQAGDAVIMSLEATDLRNGEQIGVFAINKMFVENIGKSILMPIIDSELIGIEPGNHKQFELTITPDFNGAADFIGAPVNFKVIIHKIKEKRLPHPFKEVAQEETPQS